MLWIVDQIITAVEVLHTIFSFFKDVYNNNVDIRYCLTRIFLRAWDTK